MEELKNESSVSKAHYKSYKAIVIGNCGVGKTTIIIKACLNKQVSSTSTLGIEEYNYYSNNINIQIWDTSGQEKFRSIYSNFYKKASLAILVFSFDDKESFNDLDFWIKEVRKNSSPNCPIILVGNKLDLEHEIHSDEISNYIQTNNINYYIKFSAFEDEGINEMMKKAVELLSNNNHVSHEKLKSLKLTNLSKKNLAGACMCFSRSAYIFG